MSDERRTITHEELLARANDKHGYCEHGPSCERIERSCWPEAYRRLIPEVPRTLTPAEAAAGVAIGRRLASEGESR